MSVPAVVVAVQVCWWFIWLLEESYFWWKKIK